MQGIYQTYYRFIYKPMAKLYLKTDSNIGFDGFRLKVYKDVFHPKLFFSSGYFYDFLKHKDLSAKQFLEIGCGSGILSLLARRKQALVTAVDVDPKAVENTKFNFDINFPAGAAKATILQSDVFSRVPQQAYDVIVINPPYYFKNVTVAAQLAWYCGENGYYFSKLFSGLKSYMSPATSVYMVLAENAEIARIKGMAAAQGLVFSLADQRKIKFETSYIFQLTAAAW